MTTRLLNAFSADQAPFEELSRVALLDSVSTSEGTLPSGASGTVVSVYSGGEAYCVEFSRPFSTLVTIGAAQLRAIPEATRERLIADAAPSRHRSEKD